MSKDMTIGGSSKVPAHLRDVSGVADEFNAAAAGGIAQGFPRISIRGSRFRIVQGGEETVRDSLTMEVIVVGANPHLSKTYYGKNYDPDAEDSSPLCFSDDGVKPDQRSREPQCSSCAACPQNAWGSRITDAGKEVKACSDLKRVAVVGSEEPGGQVFALSIPAASLKNWSNYITKLDAKGVKAYQVITQLGFDAEEAFPKLTFKPVNWIDEEQHSAVIEKIGSTEAKVVTAQLMTSATPAPEPAADTSIDADDDDDDLFGDDEQEPPTKPVKKKTAKKTTKKKTAKKKPEPEPEEDDDDDDGAGELVDDETSELDDELDDILDELDFND